MIHAKQSRSVPQLRFPEFEKGHNPNLKKYSFDDIFLFTTGKNIKQREASPDFETPCVRYGELYHMYKEVISEVINRTNLDKSELHFSEGNEILLPSAGEDPLDIGSASALTINNVAIGRTINILKPKLEAIYSQIFVSYYINQNLKRKISSLAKGVSISNVYNSDLKTLEIILPSLPEQTRIATFLTAVDKRINLLQKKKAELEQYKKGLMQKIFNGKWKVENGKRKFVPPTIRFKPSDEELNHIKMDNDASIIFNSQFSTYHYKDWEVKRLGEVLDYLQPTNYLVSDTEYRDEYVIPVLTAGKTFLLGYTNESEGVFSENLPTIIFDDFTTAFQFVDFPFKAKSSAMKMLIPKNEEVNIKFIFEVMNTIKFPLAEHKRYWISEYQNEKIPYPCPAEQQKIASFLSSIDKSIEKIGNQIAASQEWKQGLLQKMFV